MRYFIDTEFDWFPKEGTICPISIALVAEDGREYYAILTNYRNRFSESSFVAEHVRTVLQSVGPQTDHKDMARVRDDIVRFIGDDVPEFWGDYSAFDYVMLSMIMGDFSSWPSGWPMHINDMQQESMLAISSAVPHNALADARAIRDSFRPATLAAA